MREGGRVAAAVCVCVCGRERERVSVCIHHLLQKFRILLLIYYGQMDELKMALYQTDAWVDSVILCSCISYNLAHAICHAIVAEK